MFHRQFSANRGSDGSAKLIAISHNETDWRELREIAAVDLTESFVLSWQLDAGALRIDLDLFLRPEHSFYEKPRPSEGGCFRAAEIEFPDCISLADAGKKNDSAEIVETAAALGGRKIHDLRCLRDGEYRISGKFGAVDISADRPILRIKNTIG